MLEAIVYKKRKEEIEAEKQRERDEWKKDTSELDKLR